MFEQRRLLELAGIYDKGKNTNSLNEGTSCADEACAADDAVDEACAADDAVDEGSTETEQLDEIRVRSFIRNEIRTMLNNMNPKDKRNWVLRGQRPSTNSQHGQISRGFTGPGFV